MKYFKNVIMIMMIMFVLSIGNAFADLDVDAGAEAGAEANNVQTFEASDRGFPIGTQVNYPGMPGYFGDNKPGHQFISLDKLMMYNTAWKIKDKYPTLAGQKLNVTPHAEMVAKADQSEIIICTKNVFDTDKFEVKILATGTINSSNKNTLSSDLLDQALYAASQYGATHIQFLGEGTNTRLRTSGWGIGLNYNKASGTSMSTGGTGFSTGWAGYNNLPWQQFFILKVVDPAAVAELEAAAADGETTESDLVDEDVEKAIQDATTN